MSSFLKTSRHWQEIFWQIGRNPKDSQIGHLCDLKK